MLSVKIDFLTEIVSAKKIECGSETKVDADHDDEKQKFLEKFGISFEIEFQNKNPDKLNDGFTLFTTPEGKVLLADYFYQIPEDEEYVSVPVPEKDLKAILKLVRCLSTTLRRGFFLIEPIKGN